MKKPNIPANEAERLLALRSYSVLDTEPEQAFDDLAQLAAHILDMPMALVSIVDAERQWFKARYGLAAPETPRDISFCGHVVASERPLIVNDARDDNRFADNPLVTGDPRVRFYAGMPLTMADGHVLGSLCVIDQEPRRPSPQQLRMLELLAAQVVDQLEARRGRLELAAEREQARQSAERLTTIFATMAEGITVQDADGVITDSNPAAELMLGLTASQLRGRSAKDPTWRAVRENGFPLPNDEFPSAIARRTRQPVHGLVVGVYKPDGALTWVRANSVPRFVGDELAEVVNTFHDITAMKAANHRVAQQERLATIGTLSAGLGHEINNPLAYILGNLDFALEELRVIAGPSPSARLAELSQVVGEAREGAERIRKLVKGLRALAREDVILYGVPVEGVIETSLSMAAHEIRHKATVVEKHGDVPPVLADESRLTQVLVNLLMNAAQAFEKGPASANHITITTSRLTDGRVSIAVEDNGPGIPASLMGRIFDPFFTTKPVGVGTGLGLPVSRNIINSLGGELLVQTEEGRGTRFTVVLPADERESDEGSRATSASRGRIMLIDDDPAVLNALRRVLSREHDVTPMSDPREAQLLLDSGHTFDLVICDLMMPALSGSQLFKVTQAKAPQVAERFVFMSGATSNPDVQAFLASVPNERLDKPFSSAALLELARRFVLKGRAQAKVAS